MEMTAFGTELQELIWLRRRITVWCALAMAMMVGCSNEQKSLYEHDHVVPAHLPKDLPHSSELIRERIAILQSVDNASAGNELEDLVKWIPQIAADTDLPEAAWNQLNDLAGQIREQLPVRAIERNSKLENELFQLLDLIDSAAKTLERLAISFAEKTLSSGPSPE